MSENTMTTNTTAVDRFLNAVDEIDVEHGIMHGSVTGVPFEAEYRRYNHDNGKFENSIGTLASHLFVWVEGILWRYPVNDWDGTNKWYANH